MYSTINYAPLKSRIFAFLLDYLIIVAYGVVIVGGLSWILQPVLVPLFTNSPYIAQLTGFIIMTLPVSLYFIINECSKWQGTWGKRKFSLKVVADNGNRLTIRQSVVRTGVKFLLWEVSHFCIYHLMLPSPFTETIIIIILNIVSIALVIYIVSPLTNKKRKSVYDWVAGTAVVRSE